MRLIDADELIKDRVENDPVRIAAKCAPTAFDKERVIEELKKHEDIAFETYDEYGSEVAYGEWTAYKQAEEIVEKGGIEFLH